jgi:hypothetical protein
MIEVAHLQNGSSSLRSQASASPSSSPSRPASDLAPLPIRHLKAPPSPLVNNFTNPAFSEEPVEESEAGNQAPDPTTQTIHHQLSKLSIAEVSMSNSGSQASSSLVRRVRKGQKWEDFQPPPCNELPSIQAIDSPFQLQEYLSLVLRQDPHNVEQIVALPQPSSGSSDPFADTSSDKGKARESESNPFGSMDEEPQPVDEDVWIYEQLRRLVLDFSTPWLTMLQLDCDRKKNPKTCEAMNADDWMYLCASHGEEKQCCAIDYIIHTLDGTTALLNSQRHFPSRTFIPTTSLRHFGSVSRRLSRIFVHAFEHHRDVFEACEAETSLYARFLALVQTYDLISVDALPQLGSNTKIAKDASGSDLLPTSGTQADDLKGESIASPAADEELAEDEIGRGISGKGHLFESGAIVSQEEEDDDDEIVLDEDESKQQEEVQAVKTRLERSDSASSRVTTLHVGSAEGDAA